MMTRLLGAQELFPRWLFHFLWGTTHFMIFTVAVARENYRLIKF